MIAIHPCLISRVGTISHQEIRRSFAALRERWMIEQREMRSYIDALTEETLNGVIRYVIPGAVREFVVWHILVDVIIHSTQHRSEAATLLTGYGQSPGDYDFITGLKEHEQSH